MQTCLFRGGHWGEHSPGDVWQSPQWSQRVAERALGVLRLYQHCLYPGGTAGELLAVGVSTTCGGPS